MADDSSPWLGEVAELRQYTLHPGGRDVLVPLFEEHFRTGQEEVGITVGGVFLDEDDPDRFVWMRGFPDLEARTASLQAFYGGPVWAAHRDAANGTMIDSDDVLLLAPGEAVDSPGTRSHVLVGVGDPDQPVEPLANLLAAPVRTWRPHPGPNGFPALPVREEQLGVWLAGFDDAATRDDALARLRASGHHHAQLLRLTRVGAR